RAIHEKPASTFSPRAPETSPDEIAYGRGRPEAVPGAKLLERRRRKGPVAVQVLGVDAGGDEENVDPHLERAGDVGAHRVADRERVDRRMRLARIDRLTAHLLIALRERARAINQRIAALHDEIGVGADHR